MRARKNNSHKLIAVLLAIILVLCCTIGGTLAWLSAETNAVTNTFTVGNISISLEETFNAKSDEKLDENDIWIGKIVPGGADEKDPVVSVEKGSEKCYVYVLVENDLKIGDAVVATPNIDSSMWTNVATSGNKTLYRYHEVVDAGSEAVECTVFNLVAYSDTAITKENIGSLADKNIVVDAFAHQAENIDNISVADTAAKDHFKI